MKDYTPEPSPEPAPETSREPHHGGAHEAELSGFIARPTGADVAGLRYEGFRDGGGGLVERPLLRMENAGTSIGADGEVTLTFAKSSAWVEADVSILALPRDWRDIAALEMDVQGATADMVLELILVAARGRFSRSASMEADGSAQIHLEIPDLPLAQGVRPAWEPVAIRVRAWWGNTTMTEGERVELGSRALETDAEGPVSIHIRRLATVPRPDGASPVLVDRFGQRHHGNWPGKITTEEDLVRQLAIEQAEMTVPPPFALNRFGGRTDLPRSQATGFFRVEQDERQRWWFIDPEGCRFWSMGTTGVRLMDTTIVSGREEFFEELPDPNGPFGGAWNPIANSPANDSKGQTTVAFYHWNVLRKFGGVDRWPDHVLKRLRSWGFNTLGNWSEIPRFVGRDFPYTVALSTFVAGARTVGQHFPDVWNPDWKQQFDRQVGEAIQGIQGFRDDPFLLGYFVDNEMGWGSLGTSLANTEADSHARKHWVEFLRNHVPSLAEWNQRVGTHFCSWEELMEWKAPSLPSDPIAAGWFSAAKGFYAEAYFQTVRDTLRRHDPSHLYLGCRFVRRAPAPAICEAAGRYCDVVTVNSYDLWPRREEFGPWYQMTKRPILIGEHHLPLATSRQVPPLYPAFTAEERRRLYVEMVRNWSEQPWAVGCHWFQHADQHPTGRPRDGENQPVGFVDITDTPHAEMVAAAREATAHVMEWHSAATNIEKVEG